MCYAIMHDDDHKKYIQVYILSKPSEHKTFV